MKRIVNMILMLAMATSVMAQVPDLISYQAVVRNTSNQLIINQNVTIKISILEGVLTPLSIKNRTAQTPMEMVLQQFK